MSAPIHDHEPDTGEAVVRGLLRAECQQWWQRPLDYLETSGTDNAMWRVRLDGEPDVVVRLPRRPSAASGLLHEMHVLQRVAATGLRSIVAIPSVRHIGQPQEVFPHHWAVLEWVAGTDAWHASREDLADENESLALDIAEAVTAIGQIISLEARPRQAGDRGGPLAPLIERLNRWLDDPEWQADGLVDVEAVRRLASQGLEVVDEPVTVGFVHGDLIPGNLLMDGARLTAIIDWGGAASADQAQDLAPAWSVLERRGRAAFREAVGVDDAAWIRGRTFELEHAVGGVLYYKPRGHQLGDVMARTLERLTAGD